MTKPTKIEGRIWVIRDDKGARIDNIDTDMIYHNKHLAITDINEMGQYIFGNLDGWKEFPKKAQKDDILVVGRNFGSGSSRQHAVDGFVALGMQAIIGESFGAIYWRNAVNAGVPVLEAPDIMASGIESGQIVSIDLESGGIEVKDSCTRIQAKPMSEVQRDIYNAGGLFEYAK
jgi:3-isopropylmalate/(R)-2-methylmalate dehydratase small subunit